MKASDSPYRKVEVLPTPYPNLNKILGVGGIPFRRITEVSGVYSVGKTTLALSIIAAAQRAGHECLWADAEFSWDEQYAVQLGVDIYALDLTQEQYAEATLDAVEEWLRTHKGGLVVLDSIGGLLPRAEAEKDASGRVIGGQAKLIATFCRKVVPLLAIHNNALIVLNHEFTDLMSNRLMTSGGAKLGYHKSIWLRLKKAGKRVMQGDKQIGEIIEAEIRKNKVASTLKESCELTMLYGHGFSVEADKAQDMLDAGAITKKGKTYFHGENKIGVGMAKVREYVKTLA